MLRRLRLAASSLLGHRDRRYPATPHADEMASARCLLKRGVFLVIRRRSQVLNRYQLPKDQRFTNAEIDSIASHLYEKDYGHLFEEDEGVYWTLE
jgi:hypothetical protein